MVGQADLKCSRSDEMWRRLEDVNDPELDEPVTEMGFVERAEILADGHVEVDFRLPTYWCSPNFAFLMLDGLRQALDGLSWSPAYRIRLHDHMFAEEVNRGIEAGQSFSQIFDTLAGDQDMSALRETFDRKAFMRRQEAVLLGLRANGLTDGEIADMDLGAVRPEGLAAHLAALRSVRINMEFNGALCRGLKATRYKEVEVVEGEPTLVDFILDRVPSGGCGSPSAHS